ncbi:MAG: hypothetical protein JSV85_06355 [Candidatus Bathyarchaeota archaeon]|nr:MAG: hypothetical protein JSV85_06355 [Candidatus Bathyarchaeota archaeon]
MKAKYKVISLMMFAAVLFSLPALTTANNSTAICVWQDTDGDGVKDNFLGQVHAYSGGLTGADNYNWFSASAHPIAGPTPVGYESKMYFYQGTDGLSLGMFHNIDAGGSPNNVVNWDIDVTGTDADRFLSDDNLVEFSETTPNHFDGAWHYWFNTDGGVIGNLTGNWEIVITPNVWGDMSAWDIYSDDGSSIGLEMRYPAHLVVCQPAPVDIDIKPASWPNPLNVKSKGVLPVAVCGTEDFDVTTIDPATIRLTLGGAEVAPLRWSLEDVATPYVGEPCGGHDLGGDGYLDLALKFKVQEVVEALGLDAYGDGDVVALVIVGNLKAEHTGSPIRGQDCVVILN